MVEQRAERSRPDIFAADEAQPIEPLLVGKAQRRFVGGLGRSLGGSVSGGHGGCRRRLSAMFPHCGAY
jgi:hypothetical protein